MHDEEALIEDLSKIVTWMEKLKELNTVDVSPLYTIHWEPNIFQEDMPQASLACEKGLANAPSKDSNYFRVPKVKGIRLITSNYSRMKPKEEEVFRTLNIGRIWLPVAIGIGIVVYLFVSDGSFTLSNLGLIGQANWRYMLLAFLAIFVRDLGYIYRIKVLTNSNLSWLSQFLYHCLMGVFFSRNSICCRGGSSGYFFVA